MVLRKSIASFNFVRHIVLHEDSGLKPHFVQDA